MNIDVYSDRAKQAIQSAQSLALARGHQQLAPEHLLKVLLEEKDGLSRALIESAGGRPDEADKAVDTALGKIPKVEGGSGQLMRPRRRASSQRRTAPRGRRRFRHHRAPAHRHLKDGGEAAALNRRRFAGLEEAAKACAGATAKLRLGEGATTR